MLIDRRDTPANPSHDGNRHGIADGLVAWPIGTFLGGLALPRDQRMPIGETLQAFALDRRQTANGHVLHDCRSLIAPTICAGKRRCLFAGITNSMGSCSLASFECVSYCGITLPWLAAAS